MSGSARILVLGRGAQGTAAAYDLLQREEVAEVVVADRAASGPPPALERFAGKRLRFRSMDAADEDSVRREMEGMDAVLCALPYYLNLSMSRIAVESGAHFCDLGGNTEIVERQREMDEQARGRGVSVVPDCGLAPGMVNILAQGGIDELDETDSVHMWVGGLPQEPLPPLNYQVVYSLEGVLDYYTTPGLVLDGGEPRAVEPLSGLERLEFPEPAGTLEAFYTAGGASTLPYRYRGRIATMEYRTLRYPGHADIMRAIRDLGLLDTEPVDVDGVAVSPRRLFIERVSPILRRPGARDLVVLRVEVRGKAAGEDRGVRFDLMDFYDEESGLTAMMRCTGFSLAVTALMQVRGDIAPGVHTPDEAVPAGPYLRALEERGVRVLRRAI